MQPQRCSAVLCALFLTASLLTTSLLAQAPPEFPKPTKEHKWLEKFQGEWESTTEMSIGPDQPALTCKGSMKSHMLGDFWIVNESTSDMMGSEMKGLQTIGYDAKSKKYVGTWVDNMLGHMWHYTGEIDDSGKKITLQAEGPNFMAAGKMTQFRDAYEFKSADHIIATSSMQMEDGKWITFMTGEIRRKAADKSEKK